MIILQKIVKMKLLKIILLFMALCLVVPVGAKKYKFDIDSQRNVVVKRSGSPGQKIVEVVAIAGSVDKAISQALVDAAAALTFEGASGSGEMGACPPVLAEGKSAYEANKGFFDDFFKHGGFLRFVRRVSNAYPTGEDNVKVKGDNQIRITLIVDWQGLASYYNSNGLKTSIGNLQNF